MIPDAHAPVVHAPDDHAPDDHAPDDRDRQKPISINFHASRSRWAKDHSLNHNAYILWGGASEEAQRLEQNLTQSNVRRMDYAGPQSCKQCHERNYDLWSAHPHRRMNALATEENVFGDFSGGPTSRIEYRGGTADFYQENGEFFMRLARDDTTRIFRINRTIGSRKQQYYVGTLSEGPEPPDHPFRNTDHVLPFGFELTRREWIPLVHVGGHDGRDDQRADPFIVPSDSPYDFQCSICHTTHPMGNMILTKIQRFAFYTPRDMHFVASAYLDESYPGKVNIDLSDGMSNEQHVELRMQFVGMLEQENAVHLGIGCEACHLGAKAHVENEDLLPLFYPSGKHVFAEGGDHHEIWGRTDENKNFICARCHSGERRTFAAGMSTWNSTEYSDALRGSCYHPNRAEAQGKELLTCVTCHDPHEATGPSWTRTPAQDDAVCIKCHDAFRNEEAVSAHTHHSIESTGSRCMDCHMPRLNEGMADVVRTHMIFSPTNTKMLEANQPNACNMCHVEKSIDWTLRHLKQWYGLQQKDLKSPQDGNQVYSGLAISANYTNRDKPATLGWLQSDHQSTRLVAADVLSKAKAKWAIKELLRALDDPHMENRLFTLQRLEDHMDIFPSEFGYKVYMTADERRASLDKLYSEFSRQTEK